MSKDNETFKERFDKLIELSGDEKLQHAVDMHFLYQADKYAELQTEKRIASEEGHNEGHREGRKEGHDQATKEIVKNMLKQNIDINIISKSTGLAINDIEKLRDNS